MTSARRLRSTAGAGLVALIAAVAGFALAAPSPAAASPGACDDGTGVTIVIDFQQLGGGVNVACAPQPLCQAGSCTGLDALDAAGVDWQPVQRFPAFVCRIAGLPSDDPCVNTSPASASWSYWIAARGGQWCFSTSGAASRTPPPGTVEGWSFTNASGAPPPHLAPPAPAPGAAAPGPGSACPSKTTTTTTTPPAPVPATTATPAAGDGGGTGGDPAASTSSSRTSNPSGGGATASNAPSDAATSAGDTTTTTTTDPGATDRSSGDGDVAAGTVNLSDGHRSSGSPAALLVGGALVALLAGGALVLARRRRPDEDLTL